VAQLLPEFARARLNRFLSIAEPQRDCHYAALNFFRAEPDERFGDHRVVAAAVNRCYDDIDFAAKRFGDLLDYVLASLADVSAIYPDTRLRTLRRKRDAAPECPQLAPLDAATPTR
jgi:hypothetical protein